MNALRIQLVALLIVGQATFGLGTDVWHRWAHRCNHDHSGSAHAGHDHDHGKHDRVDDHHAGHSHAQGHCGHEHASSALATCGGHSHVDRSTQESRPSGWTVAGHDHHECWVCRVLSRPMTWSEVSRPLLDSQRSTAQVFLTDADCELSLVAAYDGRGPPTAAC